MPSLLRRAVTTTSSSSSQQAQQRGNVATPSPPPPSTSAVVAHPHGADAAGKWSSYFPRITRFFSNVVQSLTNYGEHHFTASPAWLHGQRFDYLVAPPATATAIANNPPSSSASSSSSVDDAFQVVPANGAHDLDAWSSVSPVAQPMHAASADLAAHPPAVPPLAQLPPPIVAAAWRVERDAFERAFHSTIWFTYRYDFPPILPDASPSHHQQLYPQQQQQQPQQYQQQQHQQAPSQRSNTASSSSSTFTSSAQLYTSDAGWGCMIRTTQMMYVSALTTHYLGRHWRCTGFDDYLAVDAAAPTVLSSSDDDTDRVGADAADDADADADARADVDDITPRADAEQPSLARDGAAAAASNTCATASAPVPSAAPSVDLSASWVIPPRRASTVSEEGFQLVESSSPTMTLARDAASQLLTDIAANANVNANACTSATAHGAAAATAPSAAATAPSASAADERVQTSSPGVRISTPSNLCAPPPVLGRLRPLQTTDSSSSSSASDAPPRAQMTPPACLHPASASTTVVACDDVWQDMGLHAELLSWFVDEPSAPYSLHSFLSSSTSSSSSSAVSSSATTATSRNRAGEWFGPTATCRMLQRCHQRHTDALEQRRLLTVNANANSNGAGVGSPSSASVPPLLPPLPRLFVADDNTLYLDQVLNVAASFEPAAATAAAAVEPTFTFHPTVILIPLRLGIDAIHVNYISSLLACFEFPQSIGIVGGKPRSSLYFLGKQDDRLLYLDPHTPQLHQDPVTSCATYHCGRILSVPVQQLDPSLAIGFYVRDRQDFDDFWLRAQSMQCVSSSSSASSASSSPQPTTRKTTSALGSFFTSNSSSASSSSSTSSSSSLSVGAGAASPRVPSSPSPDAWPVFYTHAGRTSQPTGAAAPPGRGGFAASRVRASRAAHGLSSPSADSLSASFAWPTASAPAAAVVTSTPAASATPTTAALATVPGSAEGALGVTSLATSATSRFTAWLSNAWRANSSARVPPSDDRGVPSSLLSPSQIARASANDMSASIVHVRADGADGADEDGVVSASSSSAADASAGGEEQEDDEFVLV